MRYFMEISYEGADFSGWQRQENARTVQESIENAFLRLFSRSVSIMGSGRTDAGVHARHQVAHFDWGQPLNVSQLVYQLNAVLPPSVAIHNIHPVQEEAHARFSALSRSYSYLIHTRKDPFLRGRSYYFSSAIDGQAIEEVLGLFREWKDFESFSKVHTEVNHFECHIFGASWNKGPASHVFDIRANRFLRGMVRVMVGTLLDVGTGKCSVADVEKILKSKNRQAAGRSVPACGLYLTAVNYPTTIYLKQHGERNCQ